MIKLKLKSKLALVFFLIELGMLICVGIQNYRLGKAVLETGTVTESVQVQTQKSHLQASIGVCIFPNDSTELENLIQYGHSAMYNAKRQNNQICFYLDLPRV